MSSPQFRGAGSDCTRLLQRLATVGADGWPYVVLLLHVLSAGEIGVHNAAARGHLRQNVERDARACSEVDEPVKVFDYGRFECDTGLAYRSAIAYGRIRIVDDRAAKSCFFDALLAKYGTVYAIAVERITGKHCPLPPLAEQWPALDRTKSPNARS